MICKVGKKYAPMVHQVTGPNSQKQPKSVQASLSKLLAVLRFSYLRPKFPSASFSA